MSEKAIVPTQSYRETFPRDFYCVGRCSHCGGKIKIKIKPKYYLLRRLEAGGLIKVKKSTIKTPFYAANDFFTYRNGGRIG
jgi:hypothetical protein